MAYAHSDEFIQICYECDFNTKAITATLKQLYPASDPRPHKVEQRLANYRRKGLLPLSSGNSVSAGEVLRGSSTLYTETGKVKLQWVKSDVSKTSQLEAFSNAIDNLVSKLPITPPTLSTQPVTVEDTLSIYTIGDAHVGMLSWKPESGEDNNLDIAQQRHIKAMELLVSQANPSKEAFIIDVGDFFHSDNVDNRTSASNNSLDVDGRYAKVLDIGLYLTITLIDLALQKHSVVRWRSAIGNHNEHSAIMMNKFIKAYYRTDPRVIVHDTPSPFMYHQFGRNLIGVTHGHKVKAESLGSIMSVDCEDIWSSTKFRYWYTGHVHHQSVKEYPACVVETFRTLAGKDAWHTTSGYRSGQDMRCITLHKDFGEISRNTVNIAQLTTL